MDKKLYSRTHLVFSFLKHFCARLAPKLAESVNMTHKMGYPKKLEVRELLHTVLKEEKPHNF